MTTTDFPQLDLRVLKIKDGLLSLYSNGFFADTIRESLYKGTPLREVCSMIMEQYRIDEVDVNFVIGPELIELIKTVYPPNKK